MVRSLVLLAFLLLSAPSRAGEFTVTGRFEYEDKAWSHDGWTGEHPSLPIRFADVFVTDAASGRVLGRGATDGAGEFAIPCISGRDVVDLLVRVNCESKVRARASRPFPRLRVQTPDRAMYAAYAPTVVSHPTSQDLDVGTTTVLASSVDGQEGNPFNVFDLAVAAFEHVTGPEVGMTRPVGSIRLHWPSAWGSYAHRRRAWISGDDGYDDAVILHELGHLVHDVYSDSDNPGGLHYLGQSDQDLRLAFGEGWATAFAGVVLDRMGAPAVYLDADASAQVGGVHLRLDLETAEPYVGMVSGAADEVAVACAIYDLLDGGGGAGGAAGPDDESMGPASLVDGRTPTEAWWELFVGPLRRQPAVNINHVWDAWLTRVDAQEYDRLVDVFEHHGLRFWNDAFEPDDTPGQARPLAPSQEGSWGPAHTLYSSAPGVAGPGTGDRDWYAVPLQAGQRVEIETRYADGTYDAGTQADPLLVLQDPKGRVVARDDDSGFRRNAWIHDVLIDQTGTWHVMVTTRNRVNRYGRYELRLQILDD